MFIQVKTLDNDSNMCYIVLEYKSNYKIFTYTLNNIGITESILWGINTGLSAITDYSHPITIHTDNEFISNTIKNKQHLKWYENGWVTKNGDPVYFRDWWHSLVQYNHMTCITSKLYEWDDRVEWIIQTRNQTSKED